MRRPGSDIWYAASLAAPLPPVPAPATAPPLLAAILASSGSRERELLGSALLEVLNTAFGLPPCILTVADRPQLHSKDERGRLARATYGYYRCRIPSSGPPQRCSIRVYHRTAVRGQVVSASAFTNTLLHEWVHHYDFAGLGLRRSPHTAGFFSRLRQLRSLVLPDSAAESTGPHSGR
ncbi:MAG: hypothetical protein ACP5PW_01725 [Candidatus Dormibacteria bacterium]